MFGSRTDALEERIEKLESKIRDLEFDLKWQTSIFGGDAKLRDAMYEVMHHLGITVVVEPAKEKKSYFVHAEAKTKKSK